MKNNKIPKSAGKRKEDWRSLWLGRLIIVWLISVIVLACNPHVIPLYFVMFGTTAALGIFAIIAICCTDLTNPSHDLGYPI